MDTPGNITQTDGRLDRIMHRHKWAGNRVLDDLLTALAENQEYVKSETLVVEIQTEALPDVEPVQQEIAKCPVALYVEVVNSA